MPKRKSRKSRKSRKRKRLSIGTKKNDTIEFVKKINVKIDPESKVIKNEAITLGKDTEKIVKDFNPSEKKVFGTATSEAIEKIFKVYDPKHESPEELTDVFTHVKHDISKKIYRDRTPNVNKSKVAKTFTYLLEAIAILAVTLYSLGKWVSGIKKSTNLVIRTGSSVGSVFKKIGEVGQNYPLLSLMGICVLVLPNVKSIGPYVRNLYNKMFSTAD